MTELIQTLQEWFFGLGKQYGVNPIVFGSIYVGAIPFFTLSIAWLIRNYRKNKSIILPTLSASFFFISAYLYLIIVGHNVPWWVYGVVVLMIVYGGYTTTKKVRRRIHKVDKG
ncbi:MAG: ABC transporter permease [Balneolaceae bacterium]|nr:ABC transporter permease [Balneolaceae bacterium]